MLKPAFVALTSSYQASKLPSMACFSFYPSSIIPTLSEVLSSTRLLQESSLEFTLAETLNEAASKAVEMSK